MDEEEWARRKIEEGGKERKRASRKLKGEIKTSREG